MGLFNRFRALSNVNVEKVDELKQMISAQVKLLQEIDGACNTCLTEFFLTDLTLFALHIMSSDGHIDSREVEMLNVILGTDFTKSDLDKMIEVAMSGGTWELMHHAAPVSFQILADLCSGLEAERASIAITSFIATFAALGAAITAADGDISPHEVSFLDGCVNRMKSYVL